MDAARRELEEETGYRCRACRGRWAIFHASPGMVSEGFTLVRATGLTKVGEGGGIEGEDIIVHRVRADATCRTSSRRRRAEGVAIDVKLLLLLARVAAGR